MENWFEVDKEGLARLIEKNGKQFLIFELLANSWDEDVKEVYLSIEKLAKRPYAQVFIKDDAPEGFQNLKHAYTLFADSKKKSNAELRGRFNLGEKFVLAICEEAKITTTTGTVKFNSYGRFTTKEKTEKGSVLQLLVKMNQEEYNEICSAVKKLIPPNGIKTYFNEELIQYKDPIAVATAKLSTVISDAEGRLRNTIRATKVEIYSLKDDEEAYIYEMGIPIVESGFGWHVNVMQKVPLNMNRDNVNPAYKRELSKILLNEVYDKLTFETADHQWVSMAAGVNGINKEAVKKVAELQFGKKFVALDPTDKESAEKAQTEGYTVIGARGIPKEQREQLKKFDILKSSSQLFPTTKPFSDDPKAPPAEYIPLSEWTIGMCTVSNYIEDISLRLIGQRVSTSFVKDMNATACFSKSSLKMTFNMSALGIEFFACGASLAVNRLIIHELGHFYSDSHHHEDYYKALERIGANILEIAITMPNVISKYRI